MNGYSFIPQLIRDCIDAISHSVLYDTLDTLDTLDTRRVARRVARESLIPFSHAPAQSGMKSDLVVRYTSACVAKYAYGSHTPNVKRCTALLVTLCVTYDLYLPEELDEPFSLDVW